ncbi:MAG: LON peptidase substrate-binding domain-containing protein [Planctomycetaceae bacterium]|nr:LON peptidase substrate-binding domain-containing protein [Planctomycetaceae bacterium]
MASPFDLRPQLAAFQGTAPLFPLPGTVLFPHILLPLHIFEPRYLQMTADLLKGNRLLAMALLKPSDESSDPFLSELTHPGFSEDRPAIHSTVCLGQVVAEERLPDGRYYMVLQGLARARVLSEETDTGLPYRIGRLKLLQDCYPSNSTIDRQAHWEQIQGGFRDLFPDVQLDRLFQQTKTSEVPLGILCDILAYAMKLKPLDLQKLLEQVDVDQRSSRLVRHLRKRSGAKSSRRPVAAARPGFPPRFSTN